MFPAITRELVRAEKPEVQEVIALVENTYALLSVWFAGKVIPAPATQS